MMVCVKVQSCVAPSLQLSFSLCGSIIKSCTTLTPLLQINMGLIRMSAAHATDTVVQTVAERHDLGCLPRAIPSPAQPPPRDTVQGLTIEISAAGGESIKKPIIGG